MLFLAPPKIAAEPETLEQFLVVDQTAKFSATVVGLPKPSLKWYKDGTEIVEWTEKLVLTEKDIKRGTVVSLSVRESQRADAGEYQLTATNDLGFDNAVFNLYVRGKC